MSRLYDEVVEQIDDEPVELREHPDYEILNKYPFTIRKKSTGYENKDSVNI